MSWKGQVNYWKRAFFGTIIIMGLLWSWLVYSLIKTESSFIPRLKKLESHEHITIHEHETIVNLLQHRHDGIGGKLK